MVQPLLLKMPLLMPVQQSERKRFILNLVMKDQMEAIPILPIMPQALATFFLRISQLAIHLSVRYIYGKTAVVILLQ